MCDHCHMEPAYVHPGKVELYHPGKIERYHSSNRIYRLVQGISIKMYFFPYCLRFMTCF